ncbi:hypothetical protein FACS1894199_08130 [Bacteroidia bacterium]|nr:hypothetical protein FACS1894199_08130 [Bacteroidia bacterium]
MLSHPSAIAHRAFIVFLGNMSDNHIIFTVLIDVAWKYLNFHINLQSFIIGYSLKKILVIICSVCAIAASGQKPRNGQIYNPDGIEMVFVEGGADSLSSISGFYIGKYEVTQAQWKSLMPTNPSNFKSEDNPVENITWDEVKIFIDKLNDSTGREYRLPTEREWIYAAQEGNGRNPSKYCGSDIIDEVAWYINNSGNTTHPVGQKKPNALGIYDMTGNVWEWCADCTDLGCTYRVSRGGSWNYTARYCRVSDRNNYTPTNRNCFLGFRLLLVPDI